MDDEYTPKVGDDCWFLSNGMNLPFPVTIIERVPNPTWEGRENTTNPFILADLFLFKVRRPNSLGRILRHWPYAHHDQLFTKEGAKERCLEGLKIEIDLELKRASPNSKRRIESAKRRMREVRAL